MSKTLSPPKKIENVLRLDPHERCDYFVRKVADFEQVWGLFDATWATGMASGRHVAIPFWPEQDFAAICAGGEWASRRPQAIPLNEFMSHWLPEMEKNQQICAVFPVPPGKGKVRLLYPAHLLDLIKEEMQQYE